MKHLKNIFLILSILAAAGCNRYDVDEILLVRDDISLTWKGVEQFCYNPADCQMGYNASKNEFRAQADNLSSWFVITCSEMPASEDGEIEADISWTGVTYTRSMKGLEFKVKKMSGDGMIWLWCKSAKIGVTIKKL